MFLSLFIDCLIIAYCLPFPECLFSLLLVLHPLNLLPVHRSAQRPGCDQVVHCLPFPECSTVCTPKRLFMGCLLVVYWLFIASPSQTSQHARPCAHLVHSQNGCLWVVHGLFIASLPRMLDLVHSQNGLLLVYSLFIDYLLPPFPECPFPNFPECCGGVGISLHSSG